MGIFNRMLSPTGMHFREDAASSKIGLSSQQNIDRIKEADEADRSGDYEDNTQRVSSVNDALKISAYYHGVELRANVMAQLIWQYQTFSRMDNCYITNMYGGNGQLNYILQIRPNMLMTAFELMQNLELDIIQQGNGLIYIERDTNGTVLNLWLCLYGGYNQTDDTYTITYNDVGGQRSLTNVPSSDIIHIRNTFTMDHGLNGLSTLQYMRNILTLDATNTELQTKTAANGGKVKLLVQEAPDTQQGLLARANQSELKRIAAEAQKDLYKNDVVLLNNIAKATPISMSLTDMDTLNSRSYTVEDVSRFLGVPKALLGVTSNSSYKTPDAAMDELFKYSIQPRIRAIEHEFNSKLLNQYDYGSRRIHASDTELRRLDPSTQADLERKLLEMGAKTVNEVRNDYGQPKVKEGDRVYVSAQWAELGSNKLSETQATNATGKKPNEGDNASNNTEETKTPEKKPKKPSGNTAQSAKAGKETE